MRRGIVDFLVVMGRCRRFCLGERGFGVLERGMGMGSWQLGVCI